MSGHHKKNKSRAPRSKANPSQPCLRLGRAYLAQGDTRMFPATRPPNFSWVVDGVLAGCAFPSQPAHFQFLRNHGIEHLVTLSEWAPPMHAAPSSLQHTHIVVEEFSAPSIAQIEQFVKLVDNAKSKQQGVAAHCYWGLGRTGTMLAAYLVYSESMAPMEAITRIRQLRPYSIETYEQEEAVIQYADYLVRQQATGTEEEGQASGNPTSSTQSQGSTSAAVATGSSAHNSDSKPLS